MFAFDDATMAGDARAAAGSLHGQLGRKQAAGARRQLATTVQRMHAIPAAPLGTNNTDDATFQDTQDADDARPRPEHAVVSTFDLFSVGVGPSSSHTVGPMRAGKIYIQDLKNMGILDKVRKLKVGLFGSLAATGKGHMTPQAVMMGLEGSDPETIDPFTINSRYDTILSERVLTLGGEHKIKYDMDRDMLWTNEPLPTHPNGLRFSVFDEEGDLLATNDYFSVGGGFVINERTQVDENLYFRAVNKEDAPQSRRDQAHGLGKLAALPSPASEVDSSAATGDSPSKPDVKPPPFLFRDAQGLLKLTRQQNMTIAQLVWENELSFKTSEQVSEGLLRIWSVMDSSIRDGVGSLDERLPGRLKVRRRAPALYRRLFKGFFPSLTPSGHSALGRPAGQGTTEQRPTLSSSSSSSVDEHSTSLTLGSREPLSKSGLPKRSRAPLVVGNFEHELEPVPWKKEVFPGIDFLSCYAIAVNEQNAAGGRVVTAPTNGAAGVIPAVLKYVLEFISDNPDRDCKTFLLTAAAVGMLFKRGATISAAEGGCMAEVGVATAMAAAGYTSVMGGSPEQILQAAEIGIEHSLGLTCDPIDGLVQVPCIERNALGATKAVSAAQLALAGSGEHHVTLDEAIEAMRLTARDMHSHYKETSLSGLATSVKIPLSLPAC
ncbi:hypothetical protein ACM66B_003886 [Microbotryomycetes sp. NB124-2]